jgi:hypothetical protein
MPRWYYLLMLRVMKWISAAGLIVAGIIALCILADWFGHLGWGYPGWAAAFVILYSAIAFAVMRGTSTLIKRTKGTN